LTENVGQSLDRIISSSIQDKVIPAISDISSKAIDRKLTELLPNHISTTVQREVKSAIPNALQHALKDQQLHRTISEQVAQKVQIQVSGLLQQSLPSMATTATQKMVNDLETRTNQRLQQATIQQQQANAQINQLTSMVRSLSDTIQQMSDSQKAFQEQILALQRERSSETTKAELPSESEKAPTYEDINPQQAAEHREVEEITQLLMASEYEKATIQVSSFATSLEAQ
jgi:outer membrane murein-binding lipoprotein Lpp